MYGCYNRPPLKIAAKVQSGWFIKDYTRTALMIKIPDPMSKECEYQKMNKTDPRCDQCIWKTVN